MPGTCIMEVRKGSRCLSSENRNLKEALNKLAFFNRLAIQHITDTPADKNHILYQIVEHDADGTVAKVIYFRDTYLSDTELDNLQYQYHNAYFGAIHTDNNRESLAQMVKKAKSLKIAPVTLKTANAFVHEHHRHHDTTQGCRFAIGLVADDDSLAGVAICGRPVSRHLDSGLTLEVTRLCCTTQIIDACSMLYSACARIAKDMWVMKKS